MELVRADVPVHRIPPQRPSLPPAFGDRYQGRRRSPVAADTRRSPFADPEPIVQLGERGISGLCTRSGLSDGADPTWPSRQVVPSLPGLNGSELRSPRCMRHQRRASFLFALSLTEVHVPRALSELAPEG